MAETEGILCVGLVCLDVIYFCDHYPREDEDIRAQTQKWSRGGNAANTSAVLSLLGRTNCHFLGTLGSGMETEYVIGELDHLNVSHAHCVVHRDCRLPTSAVVISRQNGSRTIVHYRNLPELTVDDFNLLSLSQYSWIHFEVIFHELMIESGNTPFPFLAWYGNRVHEGRSNTDEISQMIAAIREYESHDGHVIKVSVELEKAKPELIQLAPLADVVLLSKVYACYHGYSSPEEACVGFREKCKEGVVIICAWGDRGAAATNSSGQLHKSHSYPPVGGVVDTLGAGDTFNAAVIHRLCSNNADVAEAISYGCWVAGAKCGMEGFEGIKHINFSNK